MKHLLLFSALLLSTSLFGQANCQAIDITYTSISPQADADGFIDLCAGETITVSSEITFPENGTEYLQSLSTSSFSWRLNGQEVGTDMNVTVTPSAGQGSLLRLEVTDTIGCVSVGAVIPIRIAGPPELFISSNVPDFYCLGDPFMATVDSMRFDSFYFSNRRERNETLWIQDGSGVSFEDVLNISDVSGVLTADQAAAIEICMTIEHSYLGDLDVELVCPDGSTNLLFSGQAIGGGGLYLGEPIDADNEGAIGIGYEYCFTLSSAAEANFEEVVGQGTAAGESVPEGTYVPMGDFSSLVGCSLAGDWVLRITDNLFIDDGYLFGWSINLPSSDDDLYPPFTAAVTGAAWATDGNGYVSSNGNTVEFLATEVITHQFVVTDDRGCTHEIDYVQVAQPGDAAACLECEELIVDAGPDVELACTGGFVFLDANGTTLSNSFTYFWSRDGNLIDPGLGNNGIFVTNPGQYVLTLVRDQECVLTDTVEVILGEEIEVEIGIDTLYLDCNFEPFELTAETYPEGDNFFYFWSVNPFMGEHSESPTVTISGPGVYTFVVYDSIQCEFQDVLYVIEKDYSAEVAVVNTACDVNDGSITVTPGFEDEIISYAWSTGASGPSISGLGQGDYGLTITTATCTQEEVIYVDKDISCKATIAGFVVEDPDCDDSGPTVECIMIHLLPDDIYTYTDANGRYEFLGDGGNDFTVEYIEEDVYNLTCGSVTSVPIGVVGEGETAAGPIYKVEQAPIQNLCVSISSGPARPGFSQYYCPLICNYGNLASPATFTFTIDPWHEPDQDFLDYVTSYDADTRTATLEFPSIAPGDCEFVPFYLPVSVDAPLDSTVTVSVELLPVANDAYPENNYYNLVDIITGSYDPNDKQNRTGEGPFGGAIYEDDLMMRYQVRFQNTGTDTAFTVVIRDTLAAELDVESIRPGLSSHDYTVEFEGRNVLIFRFDDILLPDSTTNLERSQGFINFTIMRDPELPFGTEIVNDAAIFFDFNQPIITNEVVNVLTMPSAVRSPRLYNIELAVFPNPTSDVLSARFEIPTGNGITHFNIYDMRGKLLRNEQLLGQAGSQQFATDVSSLPAGQYVLEIVHGGRVGSALFSKE